MMPVWMSVSINTFVLLIWVAIYRSFQYWSTNINRSNRLPAISLLFMLSAIFCSIIDSTFWGGSIDYISLLSFVIFDIKDIYLFIAISLMFYVAVDYSVHYYKLPKTERGKLNDKLSVFYWVKLGLPTKPVL
jgi:hypothetical protein